MIEPYDYQLRELIWKNIALWKSPHHIMFYFIEKQDYGILSRKYHEKKPYKKKDILRLMLDSQLGVDGLNMLKLDSH